MRQQLPDMEFGRRMAVERELEKVDGIRLANIIFDETGHFVLYGTMLGIKVINVETNRYRTDLLSSEHRRYFENHKTTFLKISSLVNDMRVDKQLVFSSISSTKPTSVC